MNHTTVYLAQDRDLHLPLKQPELQELKLQFRKTALKMLFWLST